MPTTKMTFEEWTGHSLGEQPMGRLYECPHIDPAGLKQCRLGIAGTNIRAYDGYAGDNTTVDVTYQGGETEYYLRLKDQTGDVFRVKITDVPKGLKAKFRFLVFNTKYCVQITDDNPR